MCQNGTPISKTTERAKPKTENGMEEDLSIRTRRVRWKTNKESLGLTQRNSTVRKDNAQSETTTKDSNDKGSEREVDNCSTVTQRI